MNETVIEISEFMKLLGLLIFMFSTGIYMIQINRMENSIGETDELIFPYDKSSQLNLLAEAIFFQYNVLLGDFEGAIFRRSYENLSERMKTAVTVENTIVTIYFICTTFFTQITILNMLIAIMSQTYTKHSERLAELGKRQKLKLMSEYLDLVSFYQKFACRCCKRNHKQHATSYLFMLTPLFDDNEIES